MRRSVWMLAGLVFVAGCGSAAPPPAPASDLLRTATIKDIMDAMVDPSGDFLFESVVQIADETGIHQKAPQTDDEWQAVRRHAFLLLEAPNLLTMDGRIVAAPGERSKFPEVELQPEQIQAKIAGDRPAFVRRARRLQDAAAAVIAATQKKDVDALFMSIELVDRACENCHLHYWYPNDSRAIQAAKESGVLD